MVSALLVIWALLASDDPISVVHNAPTTQVVSFDPAHPPKNVEKLQHGEDGLTRMLFNCTVKPQFQIVDQRYRDQMWHVEAKLTGVEITLDLFNTIYLPPNVNAKLKAHELGHARINGIIYEDAEPAARDAAKTAMEQTFKATAPDFTTARKAISDQAVNTIAHDYLKQTADKAYRIGEIYDDLTKHGTNAKQEDDGIREAMQKYEKEQR